MESMCLYNLYKESSHHVRKLLRKDKSSNAKRMEIHGVTPLIMITCDLKGVLGEKEKYKTWKYNILNRLNFYFNRECLS